MQITRNIEGHDQPVVITLTDEELKTACLEQQAKQYRMDSEENLDDALAKWINECDTIPGIAYSSVHHGITEFIKSGTDTNSLTPLCDDLVDYIVNNQENIEKSTNIWEEAFHNAIVPKIANLMYESITKTTECSKLFCTMAYLIDPFPKKIYSGNGREWLHYFQQCLKGWLINEKYDCIRNLWIDLYCPYAYPVDNNGHTWYTFDTGIQIAEDADGIRITMQKDLDEICGKNVTLESKTTRQDNTGKDMLNMCLFTLDIPHIELIRRLDTIQKAQKLATVYHIFGYEGNIAKQFTDATRDT